MDWTLDTLGGARVAYARHDGTGVPIVLVGAWPQTLDAWDRVWAKLDDRTRLALDLPGFGHSAPASTTPSSAGQFLVDALDDLGWDQVHLVAPDVGVPAAFWVATHHPERLRSMVVSDGPGTWPPSLSRDLSWMVYSGVVRWLLALDPARFVRIALRRGYTAGAPRDAEAFVAAYRDKLRRTLGFIASYPQELPSIAANPSIKVATLALWGGDDVFVLPENAHAIAATLPNGHARILDGAGHFSHDDAPEAYAEALLTWLDTQAMPHRVAHVPNAHGASIPLRAPRIVHDMSATQVSAERSVEGPDSGV